MDEAANPDLRWRYEQDYNRMVSEKDAMKKEMESLGYGKAKGTATGDTASTAKGAATGMVSDIKTAAGPVAPLTTVLTGVPVPTSALGPVQPVQEEINTGTKSLATRLKVPKKFRR